MQVNRRLGSIVLGCVTLTFSGCWEEIHYTPSKSPVAQSTEPKTEVVAQAEEPEFVEPVEEPTSDELFGGVTEPKPPTEEPTELPEEMVVESVPLVETPLEDPPFVGSPSDEPLGELFGEEDDELPPLSDEMLDTEKPEPANLEWTAVLKPSRTALAAWKMSSRWSYAAAVYAKGLEEEYYGETLQQANYAAELLEMELPVFPTAQTEDLQSAVINYLLHTGRSQMADQLGEKYSPEYAALAELAVKSHVLLLVYTPKSQYLDPIVTAIRRAAENSTLPPSLWEELVELLEQRAPYSEVKASVLKLHEQVGKYLSGSSE